jgi:hypothetical protein
VMRVPYRTASASYPVITRTSPNDLIVRLSDNQAAGKPGRVSARWLY